MATEIPQILSKELTDNYDIVSNAFVSKEKEFETEIGDIKDVDFQPQIKIKRWNNECNFSVRLVNTDLDTPTVKINGNKIQWQKEKVEVHAYPIGELGKEGSSYEFRVILKEKPTSNILEFTTETKGLRFTYQPELTQKQISSGYIRPDNVIGSYAVYHATKKNHAIGQTNYKTGKAFHIYRPKSRDFIGNSVWCELNIDIDNKLLTVTIPQDFLDNATYPIINTI